MKQKKILDNKEQFAKTDFEDLDNSIFLRIFITITKTYKSSN